MNTRLLFLILSCFTTYSLADTPSTTPLQDVTLSSSVQGLTAHNTSPTSKDTESIAAIDRTNKHSANIIGVEAHNPNWFTQGFYKEPDSLFISTGLYGKSAVIVQRKTPPSTKRYLLPKHYFAEGLTVIGNTLYLLSWKEQTLFLFDKTDLKLIDKIHYQGEGWGLTHRDANNEAPAELIMSNGSNTLYFRDATTFAINRTLKVTGLDLINELEYHNGIIWANRWYDNHLYGIDSRNGCIVAKVDLLPLRKQAGKINNKNVVNGVAYDKKKDALWVTGKLWSKRFLIEIPPIDASNCL